MTQHISDLHPQTALAGESTKKYRHLWLYFGAIGIGASIGYAALAFTGWKAAPPPSTDEPVLALAAQKSLDDPEGQEAAPLPNAGAAVEEILEAEDEIDAPRKHDVAALEPGAFYVQVASYKIGKDADDHASALAAQGLPAKSSADPANAAWRLVRVGPFETRADAEKARFALKLNERREAYVVPRSNGKYHVQVGSFATREEADPVARKMAERGHVTKISRIKMGAQRWHCVRIGPFDTADEASGYLDLVELPGSKPVVIPYGPPKP